MLFPTAQRLDPVESLLQPVAGHHQGPQDGQDVLLLELGLVLPLQLRSHGRANLLHFTTLNLD